MELNGVVYNGLWTPNNRKFLSCRIENQKIKGNKIISMNKMNQNNFVNLFGSVQAVIFKNCEITNLPENIFDFFDDLTILEIDSCQIELKNGFFNNFNQIKEICILRTKIPHITENLFDNLVNLEAIELFRCEITQIDVNCFRKLKNQLKFVDLRLNPDINAVFAHPDYGFDGNDGSFDKFECIDDFINHIDVEEPPQLCQESNPAETSAEKPIKSHNVWLDILKILPNEDFKDFTITIGTEKFKVHKIILAARCPLFADMIRNNPDADSLNLVDISIEIFKIILNYIYNDEMPQNSCDLMEIFAAAGRLQLDKLKDFVGIKVVDFVTVENAFEVLVLANKYQHDKLKKISFDKIKEIFLEMNLKDEMADNVKYLGKLIDAKRVMDEEVRKAREKFEEMSKLF